MGEMLLNGRLYGASGIRELTQAQYDALPASKLTDGILYCIKDTGIVEGEKFAPVIYSLEEREIGVWTDGKPLYQKTVHVGSITRNTQKTVTCNVGAEKVVHLIGYAYSSYYHQWFSLPYYHAQSRYCVNFLYLDNNNSNGPAISVTTGSELDLDDCYVTIQYTKTTDIPGSGTWGTDGVPMVHYDGNEKVIGTWFGETLYEKSFEQTLTYTDYQAHSVSISTGITNFNKLVDIKAVVKCGNTTYSNQSAIYSGAPGNSNDTIRFGTMSTNNGVTTISFLFGANYAGANYLNPGILMTTIQYTKTS